MFSSIVVVADNVAHLDIELHLQRDVSLRDGWSFG